MSSVIGPAAGAGTSMVTRCLVVVVPATTSALPATLTTGAPFKTAVPPDAWVRSLVVQVVPPADEAPVNWTTWPPGAVATTRSRPV